MQKLFWVIFFMLLGAGMTACGDDDNNGPNPIVGDWAASEDVGSYTSELKVEEDLEGEATLYFYDDDDNLYYADFQFSVEDKGGGEYEFDMECTDISSLDFTMDCEMNNAKDELDCDGDGGWNGYDFTWEKD